MTGMIIAMVFVMHSTVIHSALDDSLFNLQTSLVLSSPLYAQGDPSTERFSVLPEVTQLSDLGPSCLSLWVILCGHLEYFPCSGPGVEQEWEQYCHPT